jgi:hypothetical protein
MSGETERSPSSWTIDSVLVHLNRVLAEMDQRFEQRFEGQQRATDAALTSAKEAVLKAETAAERRFEGVNEFRATLADQAATLMPRAETEQRLRALTDRINDLALIVSQMQGHDTGVSAAWGYLAGAVGVVAAVVGILIGTR